VASAVMAALALTALNAPKPLQLDDATFYPNAVQIARHPLDPYGFSLLNGPANEALAPPVLPYWWAAGIVLFGEQPVLWKLWLLPISLVLTFALLSLLRRFAPGRETPLLWMITLSPAVLPGYNLMFDVPALALGLAAVACMLRSCERGSLALAMVAGVLAGLSIQTKYTGLIALAVVFAAAALARRWRLGLAAGLVAGLLFVGWESFVAARYGTSHFLFHLRQTRDVHAPLSTKPSLALPLFIVLGGIGPAIAALGLAVLAARGWALATLVFAAVNYALIGLIPRESNPVLIPYHYYPSEGLTANDLAFGLFGLAALGAAAVAARRLWAGPATRTPSTALWESRLLVVWLALEVAGYFALTWFPAVRRVIGLSVVLTLVFGRLASERHGGRRSGGLLPGLAAVSVLLGLGFYVVDLCEARAAKHVAEAAAAYIFAHDPDPTMWYTGSWAFQFDAEHVGMKEFVPAPSGPARARSSKEPPPLPPTTFRRGDWIVLPSPPVPQQELGVAAKDLRVETVLEAGDRIPFRTVPCYYGARTPLQHQEGPRILVQVIRVLADVVPTPRGK
jgi:hypothetical protein